MMKTSGQENDGNTLVKVGSEYRVLALQSGELAQMLADIGPMSAFDVPRIHVPAGGYTMWTVPTPRGEEDMKEISGVILYVKPARVFWHVSYEDLGGGLPPDCSSDDLLVGVGDPGGECPRCPFNQFGTVVRRGGGRGKACRELRLLFMALPTRLLPVVVVAPPTSLKRVKQYLYSLASEGKRSYHVLTSLTLVKERIGIFDVSVIHPRLVQELAAEEMDRFREIVEEMKPNWQQIEVTSEDVREEPSM